RKLWCPLQITGRSNPRTAFERSDLPRKSAHRGTGLAVDEGLRSQAPVVASIPRGTGQSPNAFVRPNPFAEESPPFGLLPGAQERRTLQRRIRGFPQPLTHGRERTSVTYSQSSS